MMKKAIARMMSIALALVLAACGGVVALAGAATEAVNEAVATAQPEARLLAWLEYSLALPETSEDASDASKISMQVEGKLVTVALDYASDTKNIGGILYKDIQEQLEDAQVSVTDQNGVSYPPKNFGVTGVSFDPEKGFSTNEVQSRLLLSFDVPADTSFDQLTFHFYGQDVALF